MTTKPPSPNGRNGESGKGRDGRGRFAAGNTGGPGNPYAAAAGRWRAAVIASVSEEDVRAVMRALIAAAKRGEAWAVREFMDRTLGRPVEADLVARLEALEAAANRRLDDGLGLDA